MRVNEILARGRTPVPQQHMLHVCERQRPLQQRIVVKINLPNRKIVSGAPIRIHLAEQFRGLGVCRQSSILLILGRAENAANRTAFHRCLVRANEADRNPAARRERTDPFLNSVAKQGNHLPSMRAPGKGVCFKLLRDASLYPTAGLTKLSSSWRNRDRERLLFATI